MWIVCGCEVAEDNDKKGDLEEPVEAGCREQQSEERKIDSREDSLTLALGSPYSYTE